MTIDLFKYLPLYYRESRIMKALMDALGEEVPDAIGYLWKVFFANTVPEEGLWLWLQEYDAATREEVYAKMRGGGALNLEMLQALDIEAVETYKLCPEEGIVLSGNDAYFADGIYIGPLISDIYVDPDEVQVAQQLITLAGMAGFRYWLAVKSKSLVPKAPEQSYSSIALYPSYIFPSPDNYLSGQMVLTCSRVTTSIENKSLAKITHWFSPVAFFDENRYWTDDSNPGAVSKVTTSEMEMIRIFPTGDTYLDYLAPDINNNDETILSVGGEGVDSLDRSDYALLKFDLSGFELPRVYSCELFLYVASTRHFNLHTYPFDVFLLASPFDEETVTPNTAPTRLPEHVARIYLPDPLEENSDGTWISWDISSVLEFWKVHPNYGLLLTHTGYENEGYDAVYFASVNYYEGSMDNAGNWAPYLQIIYK